MATAPPTRPAGDAGQPGRRRVYVDGVELSLDLDDFTAVEALAVRKATGGIPLAAFLNAAVDLDTIGVLWWLHRRRDVPTLTLDAALGELPGYAEFDERVKIVEPGADGPDEALEDAADPFS